MPGHHGEGDTVPGYHGGVDTVLGHHGGVDTVQYLATMVLETQCQSTMVEMKLYNENPQYHATMVKATMVVCNNFRVEIWLTLFAPFY